MAQGCCRLKSTTQGVLCFRFQRALEEKRSLFREFHVRTPFQPVKGIFCLRAERTVDPYRKISLHKLKLNNATTSKRVTLRTKNQKSDLKGVHF